MALMETSRSLGATPESVTAALQEIWNARGQAVGMSFAVTPCPYSAAEIASIEGSGRRLAFLPPELATQAGRHLLGRLFPQLDCYSVLEDNVVHNVTNPSGWFDYEAAIDAPYTDLDQVELLAELDRQGRTLLTVNQYIVAAHDSQLLTGEYLDGTGSWVRVNSGIDDGRVLPVHIDGVDVVLAIPGEEASVGGMVMGYDWGRQDRSPICGGRSSGVPAGRQGLLAEPAQRVGRWSATPEIRALDLEAEWQRIVDVYLELGFHTELCMTPERYVATLPRFEAQPADYRGRFDLPMLIETRLFWRKQATLAGISLAGWEMRPEPVPAEERFRTPDRPYAAWFSSWGQRFPERVAPAEARSQLTDDEVGGNPYECAAVEILHPEFGRHGQFWDIIGYLVWGAEVLQVAEAVTERTLSSYRWRRRPEICPNLHPDAFEIFRPLVRGTQISLPSQL